MIQYANNDNEFGRAVPAASPFDPDSPVIALINISGGSLVQDGALVGDPPKPPAPGLPPVQIVAGGTDPVLLQVRDGLAAMWPVLQRIAAALKV